jgi:hypothetical protein
MKGAALVFLLFSAPPARGDAFQTAPACLDAHRIAGALALDDSTARFCIYADSGASREKRQPLQLQHRARVDILFATANFFAEGQKRAGTGPRI